MTASTLPGGAGGPLHGLKIVEFAGIGPGPLAGLMLADYGASVTVIDRPAGPDRLGGGLALEQGKRVLRLDLKSVAGLAQARRLIEEADALIEPYRPGVMERLGLGPEVLCSAHPRLIYVRLTGWGQTGPLAPRAGHDLNYVALSGLLDIAARPGQPPAIPATIIGDVAGGALIMLVGLLSALWEAQRSGKGQVIDAAMLDGACYMGTLVQALRSGGQWPNSPQHNFFRHSSHFYDCFACADGRYLSVGCIEGSFHQAFMAGLGLPDTTPQYDPSQWPALRARVQARLLAHPLTHWLAVFEGSDACVAPVLTLDEAPHHPHHRARGNHVQRADGWWPTPAPRFSRTPAARRGDAQADATGAPPA